MSTSALLITSGLSLAIGGSLAAGYALASRQMREQLRTDPLTGAANRTGILAELGRRTAAAEPFAVVLLDLDGFKQVNDMLGHATGDAVLVEVATRLRRLVADVDAVVGRLGGDEFVVIAESPHAEASALLGADIAVDLAAPMGCLGDSGLQVTASVGLVHAMDGDQPRNLLHTADYAMYCAKNAGGGQVIEYGDDTGLAEVVERPTWRWRDMRQSRTQAWRAV